jgi:DNA-directed RNA polymerase specialized sigma24 family protein
MQEKSLIERAKLFEESALAEIYDLYSDAIYRYAYRLLGNRDQAEDVFQRLFINF